MGFSFNVSEHNFKQILHKLYTFIYVQFLNDGNMKLDVTAAAYTKFSINLAYVLNYVFVHCY